MKSIFRRKRGLYYIANLIVIIFCVIRCKEKEEKDVVPKNEKILFEIHTSSDTVAVNSYLKCYAYLEKPYFNDSGIMVYAANDNDDSLEEDLSNEYDIDMEIFLNLSHDTVNRKWIDQYNFDMTAVFGRRFKSTGKDTLRGYILEYQNRDLTPEAVFKSKNVRKYYFEKEVYVVSTPE